MMCRFLTRDSRSLAFSNGILRLRVPPFLGFFLLRFGFFLWGALEGHLPIGETEASLLIELLRGLVDLFLSLRSFNSPEVLGSRAFVFPFTAFTRPWFFRESTDDHLSNPDLTAIFLPSALKLFTSPPQVLLDIFPNFPPVSYPFVE